MRREFQTCCLIFFLLFWVAAPAAGHFLTLLPSLELVDPAGPREIELDIRFTHPMAGGPVMEMAPPVSFGVLTGGKKQDLRSTLKARQLQGATAFRSSYRLERPGDHIFYLEPTPYWEPAEQKMIIHYTKVVVDGFGAEDAWSQPVGFPVEIEPLSRPYGLWTGNLFRGIVKRGGRPIPGAEVEVEYFNAAETREPPLPFLTQVIRTDERGVFAYAMPKAGWWGFAALVEGEEKMIAPSGQAVEVELGGLLWVRTHDLP